MIIPIRDDVISPYIETGSPKWRDFNECDNTYICITGPRASSKSFNIALYLFWMHQQVENLKTIVIRSENRTIAPMLLKPTFFQILKYPYARDPRNPFVIDGGVNRPNSIKFDNGGEMFFGGANDPEKILGGAYHIAWFNEIQRVLDEYVYSSIGGCMINHRAGYVIKPEGVTWDYRIISDMNPTSKQHFIYRNWITRTDEEEKPKAKWIKTNLKDHPLNYNHLTDEWFERGLKSEKDLLDLYPIGHSRTRNVYGEFCNAEGAVFPDFDDKCIEDELQDVRGKHWKHYRGLDFGADDPTCCLWAALNGDNGELLFHKEWKMSQKTLEYHAEMIKKHSEGLKFAGTVSDHERQVRIEYQKLGIQTSPAIRDIEHGLQLMNSRIGKGLFKVYKGLLIEKDHRLIEKNAPINLIEEMYGLQYPEEKTGGTKDDLPIPGNDHSIDTARYVTSQVDGGPPDRKVKATTIDMSRTI